VIRTNLATRPFYNERAVHVGLAVFALVVIALTAFNAWRITALTRDERDLNARISASEARATQLRADAARIRQTLNPQELKSVSSSATEANTIIDRRMFSWTELFNRLETTLPEDARILSIRPHIEKEGDVLMSIAIIGRRYEDIDKFIENLEATGAFFDMLGHDDQPHDDGTIQALVEGRYRPSQTPAPERTGR
jgi:Tfp pilus assembly protein PilN